MKRNSILVGLKKAKEDNLRDKFEYIDAYSDYVKKVDNRTWSSGQKKFLDILYGKDRRSKKTQHLQKTTLPSIRERPFIS